MPATILLVDTDHAAVHALKAFLTEAGYKVVCAADGYNAVHAFFESKPNLIILEYVLPGGSGADVLERIRDHVDGEDVPVIFLSILPKAELMIKVPPAPNVLHLSKPVNQNELKAILDQLLGSQAPAPEPSAYPQGQPLPPRYPSPSESRAAFDCDEPDSSGDNTVIDLDADEPPSPPK